MNSNRDSQQASPESMAPPLRKSRKIPMERREVKQDRMVSFTKRRQGLFNKAQKLADLTGSEIAVVVISEAGRPHFQGSPAALDRFLAELGGEESKKPSVAVGFEDWIDGIDETLADRGAKLGDLVELKREAEYVRECLRGRLLELKEEDRFALVDCGGEIGRRS